MPSVGEPERGRRPDPVVVADGLCRTFPGDRGIRDLDLTIPAGSIFGIVGPSGSGKTTTVRLILGTDTPEAGELTVLGRPPSGFRRQDRRAIGYLPQDSVLYPELTLRHNLNLMASLYGMPWRSRFWPNKGRDEARQRIADVLEFVDLSDRQQIRLRDASGGEQRRIGLAAAMVHEPELLILDEPTAGIDPVLRRRIWERLGSLHDDGITVIVTTQYVDEAINCDLVAFLVGGRIAMVDSPDGLRKEAFGEDVSEDRTMDDVFVTLLERYREAADRGGSEATDG